MGDSTAASSSDVAPKMAPAAAIAKEDAQPAKRTKKSETKGSKRNKTQNIELETDINWWQKLSDAKIIEEVQRQFARPKQPSTLEKMSKAKKISYVTEKIKKEVDAPTKKK